MSLLNVLDFGLAASFSIGKMPSCLTSIEESFSTLLQLIYDYSIRPVINAIACVFRAIGDGIACVFLAIIDGCACFWKAVWDCYCFIYNSVTGDSCQNTTLTRTLTVVFHIFSAVLQVFSIQLARQSMTFLPAAATQTAALLS